MIGIVPGLVLAFMETVVLTAISVAISTRLPMLPNLVICGCDLRAGPLGTADRAIVGRAERVRGVLRHS